MVSAVAGVPDGGDEDDEGAGVVVMEGLTGFGDLGSLAVLEGEASETSEAVGGSARVGGAAAANSSAFCCMR